MTSLRFPDRAVEADVVQRQPAAERSTSGQREWSSVDGLLHVGEVIGAVVILIVLWVVILAVAWSSLSTP